MSVSAYPMDEEDIIRRIEEERDELRAEIVRQTRLYELTSSREQRLINELDEARKQVTELTTWLNYWKNKALEQ